jgi:hypothetical protein
VWGVWEESVRILSSPSSPSSHPPPSFPFRIDPGFSGESFEDYSKINL